MIVTSIFVIFFAFTVLFSLRQLIVLSKNYLIAGADERAPYIVAGYLITIIINCFLIYCLIDNHITTMFSFYIYFLYIIIISMSTMTRLLGFKINRKYNSLQIIQSVYAFLFVAIILMNSINLEYFNIELNNGNFFSFMSIFCSSILLNQTNVKMIVVVVFLLASCVFNIIFDLLTHQSKKHLIINIINFYPVFFIIYFLNASPDSHLVLSFILCLVYFIIPNLELNKEFVSISNRCFGLDSRIESIHNILKTFKEDEEISSKQSFQLKLIKKLFNEDPTIKKICFSKFFNKKKQKYFNKLLDECC